MRHVSSIQGVYMLGAIALLSLGSAGCLKDVGLGDSSPSASTGAGITGTGGAACVVSTGASSTIESCTGSGYGYSAEAGSGVGGSVGGTTSGGMVGGVGGSAMGGMTTGVGGGSFGASSSGGMMGGTGGESGGMTTSVGVSSSGGMSTGSFGMSSAVSSSSGSFGSSSGSTAACQLGPEPIPCDFSHLNADCAPYGAVCDYVFSQCSCCFVHDDLSCAQDADCQSSFGADAYCSAGKCGCK